MTAIDDQKPSTMEAVGNGSYLYRWDIKEVTMPESNSIQWQCKEVTVWQPVTANKITEKVINELWDKNQEQKLINEYNAAVMEIGDQSAIENYRQFLLERQTIKEQINTYCKENRIQQK